MGIIVNFNIQRKLHMGMRRTPIAKAIATGRVLHDKKRFAGRNEPPSTGPLGPPPHWLTSKLQRDSWEELRRDVPWLQKSHRCLVGIAATLRADIISGDELDVRKMNVLRQCLSMMGATPTSNVSAPSEETMADPADRYFN